MFSEWVAFLETRKGIAPDPQRMIALAEALRSGTEDAPPAVSPTASEPMAVSEEPTEISLPEIALQDELEECGSGAEIIHIDFSSPSRE